MSGGFGHHEVRYLVQKTYKTVLTPVPERRGIDVSLSNQDLKAPDPFIEYQLKPYNVRWVIDAHKNMYAEPDMTYILMTMVRRASKGWTEKS